jgi:hypothetical protein
MLSTSQNTPHITLGNEQCLKLLLGVCNAKKRGDLSLSLECFQPVQIQEGLDDVTIDESLSRLQPGLVVEASSNKKT